MDLNQLNAYIHPIKIAHMKNSIKYRKLVKKILPLVDLPDVIYQIIFNYIGSSRFPQYAFQGSVLTIRPRFFQKNKKIFHPRALEGTESQETESESESHETESQETESQETESESESRTKYQKMMEPEQ